MLKRMFAAVACVVIYGGCLASLLSAAEKPSWQGSQSLQASPFVLPIAKRDSLLNGLQLIVMEQPDAGSVTVHNGLTFHAAGANQTDQMREALAIIYMPDGTRFDGGTDLSGGEWQKLALARAYLREAQVLVLDEPTASLDAKSEHEVFERFAELTRGKMAMLISHRFSTVRMADRIFVLQGGRIAEEGSHELLMQSGGRYAEMFELQAASYR